MDTKNKNNRDTMTTSIMITWYQFQLKYHKLCLRECLDPHLREKIIDKLEHHSKKCNELRKKQLT